MIYRGDLVKIDNTTIPHVTNYKIGRNKLWKNANRNMEGDLKGASLIGIFPKIIMNIGYTTQEEMATLTELLDRDFFTVTWFDVRIQDTVSTQYYAGDYETDLDSKNEGRYKPFSVSLIPINKRRY